MATSLMEVNNKLLILTKNRQFLEVNEYRIDNLARMDNKSIILRKSADIVSDNCGLPLTRARETDGKRGGTSPARQML